jgi:hypothetical protein
MKRWAEFERDRRRKQIAAQHYDIPQSIPAAQRPPSSKSPSSFQGYEMGYV